MSPDSTILQAETAPAKAPEKADDLKVLSHYNPYAWLGKVGLVLPSPNTIVEAEFNRLAPKGVTFHGARVTVAGTPSQESLDQMARETEEAASLLGTAECDLIVYACTSGSFMCDRDLTKQRMQAASGARVMTTSDAVIDALRALGARKVAMATPYFDFITEGEVAWLEAEGFEVVSYQGLRMGDTPAERRAINRVPPEAVYRFARETDVAEADTLFVSCTALATFDVIQQLEDDCGKPVISSNLSTFWQVLRQLGLKNRYEGFGTLLREH